MFRLYFITLLFVVFLKDIKAQAPQWNWVRSVNGSMNESASSIATDSRNGVYVYGNFTSPTITIGTITLNNIGGSDIYVTKYDTTGNVIWAKSFGSVGLETSSVITTNRAGEIIISGSFNNSITFGNITLTSQGGTDAFVAKLNNTGQVLWAKQIGGSGNEKTINAACDDAGNIYSVGTYTSTSLTIGSNTFTNPLAFNNYYLKMDAAGNIIWAKSKSNITSFAITYINAATDGTVIFSGNFSDNLNFNANGTIGLYTGYRSIFWVKSNSNGDFITQSNYGLRTVGEGITNLLNGNKLLIPYSISYLSGFFNPWAHLLQIDINEINITEIGGGGTIGSSSSFADYAVGNKLGRIYAVGSSEGNTSFGTITLNNTVSGFLVWEINESSNATVSLVSIDTQTTFSRWLNYAVIDTTTNTLYVTGNYDAVTALPGNLTVGNFTLPYLGGREGFIGKLRLTKPVTPLTILRSRDTAICLGGIASLGIANSVSGGVSPFTYNWQPAAGLANSSALTTTANPIATTNYILTVTDAAGQIIRDTVLITVNNSPAVPLITQNGNILTSSAAIGNQWYFNGSIITGATAQNYIYTMPGSYTVTVANLNGCSNTSAQIIAIRMINTELPNGVKFYYQISPNPVTQTSQLSYQLTQPAVVSVMLINGLGQTVKIFANQQSLAAGNYNYTIDVVKQGLQKGMYKIVLIINEKTISHSILIH